MGQKSLASTLRAAAAAALDYRHASRADQEMIKEIVRQAAALHRFERYRGVIKQSPGSPPVSAAAPSNKVWQLWFQTVDRAPPIVGACLRSVRQHLPTREIVVLDERNIADHVELPGHLYDRKKRGEMSNVNFSDVLRAYLLAEHGGTWLDATVYLTATPPARFLKSPLFGFSLTPPVLMGAGRVLGSSWFLHAEKGNVLLTAVRDLLAEFWRHESRCPHPYYFHLMLALAVKESAACAKAWEAMPFFSNVPPHVLQFELFRRFDPERFEEIKQMSPVHKLTHYGDDGFQPEKPDTFYRKIIAS